ncbi:hypothetical protein EC179100_5177 [Escherichia coli 179100]|nr:hypothetical protein EC179100_5177 [Escherichia coli 179100]
MLLTDLLHGNTQAITQNILFPGTPYKKKDFPREYSGAY